MQISATNPSGEEYGQEEESPIVPLPEMPKIDFLKEGSNDPKILAKLMGVDPNSSLGEQLAQAVPPV